jgi:GAF domain-containing protein
MTEDLMPSQLDGTLPSLPAGARQAFLELSQIMLASTPLGEVLERVALLAKRTIPGVDEVSVTLMEDSKVRSVAFTGNLAILLDERQYDDGFGPCLDAAMTGDTIEIPDTATDQAYPGFAREACRAGVTHTVSVGLPVPQRTIGALNMYGMNGQHFEPRALALARTFASYAAIALANAALYTTTADLARQMEQAMASRAVIEQAKGMIMAKRGCSADEAFALLRRASQRANRKLRDLAQEIVSRGAGSM